VVVSQTDPVPGSLETKGADVGAASLPRITPVVRDRAATPFEAAFTEIFEASFRRLYRLLDRLSGEPDLAADLAQEAFVRLYRRGTLPDSPDAWLITVALNLLRNARKGRSRRAGLLTLARGLAAHSDPPPTPDRVADANDTGRRVRQALDRLGEREKRLLLLNAEGYGYREMAAALGLNEASVGTLLARARRAFRAIYEDRDDAS
jgi:RNA polymerase sigma-70 factor (ECF subfamily)